MADEIIQQLGFDASAALDALAKMDTALGNFESRLGSVAEAMGTWNARGSETVQVLKDIASGATSAAAAMAKLAAAFAGQQANCLRRPAAGAKRPDCRSGVPFGPGASSGPDAGDLARPDDYAPNRQNAD